MGALVCCFMMARSHEWMFKEDMSSSRQLLSSGGEIIPGFNGDCNDQSDWEGDSFAILHVVIVVYLFLGIAIICDEQFTSSLESICNPRTGLGLSPDVAGATFMAAGSSAPELASSFMGTFVSKSDVGLGTIIGSAVFNILIIIGATAIVVGEPMQLDWKPLGRDVVFYCGSVILLILFVAADNVVDWYEALILLVYYALYIVWMYFNTGLMRKIAKMVGEKEEPKAKSRRPSFSSGMWHHDTPPSASKYKPEDDKKPEADANSGQPAGSGRGCEVQTIQEELSPLPGVPTMGDSEMQIVELGSTSHFGVGSGSGEGEQEVELPNTPTPTMGDVSADTTKKDPPSAAIDVEKAEPKEEKKEEKSGDAEEEEEGGVADMICGILSIPFELCFNYTMPDCKYEDPTDEEADEEIEKLQEEKGSADDARKKEIDAEISSLETQKNLRGQIEEAEEAEDDAKVAELSKQLFDLYEPLTWQQRAYLFTFTVSLVWITILSYFMVVLMEKIGCAWGISSFIMGITFLAMGTSVPDALGSIAVAKEGEGDMAVSNAIGSNVFDICIGLGLPWVIATISDGEGKPIIAATESIVASATILFLVVVVLFFSLWVSRHPETGDRFCLYPVIGYILFASYGAFVIFQISWTAAGLPE